MEKGKDSLDGMGMANGVLQRERLACMLGDWHASSFDEKGYPTFFFLLSCCIDGRGDGLRGEKRFRAWRSLMDRRSAH